MVKNRVTRIVKGLIPKRYHQGVADLRDWVLGYATKSYSQEGEDMVLRSIFGVNNYGTS